MDVPVRFVHWTRAWRIIPTRYPEKPVYKRIIRVEPEVREAQEVEQLFNRRVAWEKEGIIYLRPTDQLPRGKSAYNITAVYAFPSSARFSNGHYGAYYAAQQLKTAVAETTYHSEQFLKASQQKPITLRMRVLVAEIQGSLHDLRGKKKQKPDLYHPHHYSASQAFAQRLWQAGSHGIVYDSVRDASGQCVAIFTPQRIRHCRQDRCLGYEWDGQKITHQYEIREFLR